MTLPGRVRLKEAAALIGVHPETLRKWAHQGMVPFWEVGRGRYMEFDPHELSALDKAFRRDLPMPPTQ